MRLLPPGPCGHRIRTRLRQPLLSLALLLTGGVVSGTGWQPGAVPPAAAPAAGAADSFSHARHQRLACLTCHLSNSGSVLTFEPPRGCQICHHTIEAQAGCERCHEPGSVPATLNVPVAIAAAGQPPSVRTVAFPHEEHTELPCRGCHARSVTLEPVDSARTCRGCHAEHHAVDRTCATCHRTDRITAPHALPVQAHEACDACHPTDAIAPLTPTRTFCLTCHDPEVDHHRERECSACHLQSTPEAYRSHLLRPQ